ncbi:DUF4185 domain-containing protein [Methylocystis suflitae]|uniref:DUF4185 domain-containing protein n=1 Tax=Methylocystis suflitae TaxID=2951405 RepID=UPI00210932D0|nr:DUF4185 domain-containing protein [Methylocystis suflitae]MCQ4188501.1 DUF4185 domain-containing protein [Methylocystis suflitae]
MQIIDRFLAFVKNVPSCRFLRWCLVLTSLLPASVLGKPMPPEPVPDNGGARSQKVCQMTGDLEFETVQPTKNPTGYYNVPGTDLGSPFEHNGRQYFLFGDTNGADDGIAFTTARAAEPCPRLEFVSDSKDSNHKPFKPIADAKISMKADEVPTTGFSVHGALYVFVRTGYALNNGGHVDERGNVTEVGKAALLRSDDNGLTFYSVSDEWRQGLGEKLVYLSSVRVSKADFPDLPTNSSEGLLVFGSGNYRKSKPYLAFIDLDELNNRKKVLKYFAGTVMAKSISRIETRIPRWEDEDKEARDLFNDNTPQCVGELSVTWNSKLRQWLMLYNCEHKILARVAEKPWGPWSGPAIIFDPAADGGICRFIRGCSCHERGGNQREDCAPVRDITSPSTPDNPWGLGDVYAPYAIPRYTIGGRRSVTVYYLMSTWNPYQVVMMKTTLARPGNGEAAPETKAREMSTRRDGRDFHHHSR